jgi:hypothetical protein
MISQTDSCDHEQLCELEDQNIIEWVELTPGESKDILVCACKPWNASGINVREGQQYTFNISNVEHWNDGPVKADPINGWKGKFYRSFGIMIGFLKRSDKTPWYSLVGVVGLENEYTFAVVKDGDCTFTMNKTGPLYFYANDMKGRYYNNKGTLFLNIILNY